MKVKLTDVCITCGTHLVEKGYSSFKCPSCGETVIGRCKTCRDQNVEYVCPECGFRGP